MSLNLTPLIPIYQAAIDSILTQMGKNVTLIFYETITNVNSEFADQARFGETKRPSYEDNITTSAPITVENTKIIKALIKYAPKEFEKEALALGISHPEGIVRLKTFLTDVPDLLRCRSIVPNSDSENFVKSNYRMIKQPTPVGLGIDRYAISYWSNI